MFKGRVAGDVEKSVKAIANHLEKVLDEKKKGL
jgi:hypothetical protein